MDDRREVWKLVPTKPTCNQMDHGMLELNPMKPDLEAVYAAMIAAAPDIPKD